MLAYRLITIIFSPFILAHIIWKSVSNKQARYFWQRLGFGYSKLPMGCTWFHCASVGEVNTLLPLLKNLHAQDPKLQFTITSNTITGGKIVAQQNLPYLFHSYLPFEWSFAIRRFIGSTRPAVLFVVETEIWPNLFHQCHRHGIDIHIINARLSSQTTTAHAWVTHLLKSSSANVSSISARSAQDPKA